MLEVAEGGGIALPTRKEMLIDSQHLRTRSALELGGLEFQEILEPALNGGAADALATAEPATANTIEMPVEHAATERLGCSFARQDSRETLPKATAAFAASPLVGFQA